MAAELTPQQQWATAYVSAQAMFPEVKKLRTVTVETKTGGSFSYDYADLPSILELVKPILESVGLAVAQSAVSDERGSIGVETRIYHIEGHVETFGPLFLPGGNDAQSAGSAVTYARRYSLCAALGIAADDDDDATVAVKSSRPNTEDVVVPKSPDEPHCPACLAVHGALVPVIQSDRKPYQRCTADPEDCGAPRTYQGKTYSWAGWHEDWRNSVAEYNGGVIKDSPKEVTFDPDERAARSPYIVQNVMETTGLTNEPDARLLVKPGLILAISEGSVDAVAALGGELGADPTDEELRVVIANLTLAEADAVVNAAAYVKAENERPF